MLERAAGHACGPYRVPAVAIDSTAAYTNNPPCGAMRGFGVNQTSFAIEGCMDLLAAKVGIDGWEMRWRNVVTQVGDVFTTGQVLEKGVGVEETLLAVKDAYYAARKEGRAVGVACGVKNSGLGNGAIEFGKCRLEVEADGTRRALHRLHRDGPGPAHRADPMRGGGDAACRRAYSGRRSIRASRSAPARPPARAQRCWPDVPRPKRRPSSRPISTGALRSPTWRAAFTRARS